MSRLHLTIGSECPPKVEGKLRLYSMEFCPFAQRSRLVLLAKKIPHDIVNVNLINKPEWLFKLHPDGKVPVLDMGSKIIVESLDICDYLDNEYANPPLYPAEPNLKQLDKDLIQKIPTILNPLFRIIVNQEKKTGEEWVKELLPNLEVFENELAKRDTTYFGGDQPGMVDYMFWPFAERGGIISIVRGEKLPFPENSLPKLRQWRKTMMSHPIVSQTYHTPEQNYKVYLMKYENLTPDYDSI